MTDRITKALAALALLGAFALGGAAIASAVDGDSGASSNAAATTTTGSQSDGDRPALPQRGDETLLTGDTAEKVRAAALAAFAGATIERVETDADGHAAYEAHVVKSDGTRATVYVNREFEVVGSDEGHGGPGHRGPRGEDDDDEGDSSA